MVLLTTELEESIFTTHNYINCDELIIISGYVGPNPIRKLTTLPIKTTVIYGMYGSDSIPRMLHDTLLELNAPNHEILYSNLPVHSKCYIWKRNGRIVYALIGSANFSTNGLSIPYKETLTETTSDTFWDLNDYVERVSSNSTLCTSINIEETSQDLQITEGFETCNMVLYDPRTGEVPASSGLNWGNSSKGHTNAGDGYIPIRTIYIQHFPRIFPPKQTTPTNVGGGRPNRQNDPIEIIWDDGTIMDAILEGTQEVNGRIHPKQLCSFPSKNTLGVYIRDRLGVSSHHIITKTDLDHYGRDNLSITLLQDNTYYVDFSV